jgi:DNA-directed RNA polymerase subunit F
MWQGVMRNKLVVWISNLCIPLPPGNEPNEPFRNLISKKRTEYWRIDMLEANAVQANQATIASYPNNIQSEVIKMSGEACTLPTGSIPVYLEKLAKDMEEESKKTASTIAPEFKIDQEFRNLITPLDPGTRKDLTVSLQKDGCRDGLVICKLDDQYVLLDGHNRYDICKELGIPFEATEITVSNRTEAKIWIIKNQRNRRNLDESQRAMLAVTLEALYAEEAKNRQGTRTDLGKNLDKSEAGRSAKKAADDMGVSHQTVSYAKKVSAKGIPELAGLVGSGKVAVSAAAKATSLAAESQQMVVEKVEEMVKDGKRANIAAIIRELFPKTSENDAEERFKKSQKNLATCLKLLDGIEAKQSKDKLAEMLELLGKLTARLNEIGAKNPDPTSQNALIASDDSQSEIKEEAKEANSVSLAPEEEIEFAKDETNFTEDNSLAPMDDSTELPDNWGFYGEAIENENSNQEGW